MCVYLHAYPREPPQMSLKTLLSVEELQVIFPSKHTLLVLSGPREFSRALAQQLSAVHRGVVAGRLA